MLSTFSSWKVREEGSKSWLSRGKIRCICSSSTVSVLRADIYYEMAAWSISKSPHQNGYLKEGSHLNGTEAASVETTRGRETKAVQGGNVACEEEARGSYSATIM